METQARYFAVGSFVFLLLLGTLGFVLWMGKKEFSSTDNLYDIYFQGSVTGLKIGAQVLYRGVPVGSVQSIIIDPNNIKQIRVRTSLLPTTPIRQDTEASLEMQGITGLAFVQLSGGSPQSPSLKASKNTYPVIPSKPSKIEEIFEAAPKLLQNLNKFTHNLDLILTTSNTQNIASILEHLQRITQVFANKSNTLEHLLDRMDTTFKDVSETSKSLSSFTQTLQNEFIPLAKNARDFFQESREFLETNKVPLQTFLTSGLYEFSNVMSEFRITLETINRLSLSLERDPWSFIFGTGDDGYVLN